MVKRDRNRVQSRLPRSIETETESGLVYRGQTRPKPSPVSFTEVKRDRNRVRSRLPRSNETETESGIAYLGQTRLRPRPGLEPQKVRDRDRDKKSRRSRQDSQPA